MIKNAYTGLKELFEKSGERMPVNKGANRALDCAVIQYVHQINIKSGDLPYDTKRSSFKEEGEDYPRSNFTDRLYIEIGVIHPESINGYFLPRPIDEFNPYLKNVTYVQNEFRR
ncbi:MAG: hypothetical protein ABI707_17180 [Ferruginibacter sp.]